MVTAKAIDSFKDGWFKTEFEKLGYKCLWPQNEIRTIPEYLFEWCKNSGAKLEVIRHEETPRIQKSPVPDSPQAGDKQEASGSDSGEPNPKRRRKSKAKEPALEAGEREVEDASSEQGPVSENAPALSSRKDNQEAT